MVSFDLARIMRAKAAAAFGSPPFTLAVPSEPSGGIHDGFDFEDENQWLGNWRCDKDFAGFDLQSLQALHNFDFQNFRTRTGYGCDFRIMSLPHIVREVEYWYDTPQ